MTYINYYQYHAVSNGNKVKRRFVAANRQLLCECSVELTDEMPKDTGLSKREKSERLLHSLLTAVYH